MVGESDPNRAKLDRPDYSQLKEELLEHHRRSIQAHFDKDVEYLLHDLSPEFFAISDAEIKHPTVEEQRKTFTDYLNHTAFNEYRDLVEPEIGFSDDGSLAWMNVKVKVSGNRKGDDGTVKPVDFTCAWLTLYRRVDDGWLKLGEVSTWR
jgi:hypothetical protein